MILFTYENVNPQYINELKNELREEIIVKDVKNGVDSEMAKAEIIVGFGPILTSLTEEVLDQFTNLKWLHTLTAGLETIPFEILERRGILVTNSKGIHGTQVSEQIFGVIISFTRGLHFNLRNQLKSNWNTGGYQLDELYGKTLCIIGAGSIGREVARKAKAFDMKVIGVKKSEDDLENFDSIVNIENLQNVLKESDFIVTLVPLTSSTYHLIGDEEFNVMKKTGVFLNFSRGDVVDEEAMIRALQNGRIRGAGLDVFHIEPLPEENPLWKMENVVISPHNSGITPNIEIRQLNLFKLHYVAYCKGSSMPNQVDLKKKY